MRAELGMADRLVEEDVEKGFELFLIAPWAISWIYGYYNEKLRMVFVSPRIDLLSREGDEMDESFFLADGLALSRPTKSD